MTRYLMSNGATDLDVLVADDVDLDGTFDAIDVDTGEPVRIHGWLVDSIEPLEEVDQL